MLNVYNLIALILRIKLKIITISLSSILQNTSKRSNFSIAF